jgi:CxxC motif-containing protein
VVSVKTSRSVPKEMMFEVMKEINRVRAEDEVKIGDVIIAHVSGTDADVIATSNGVNE